MKKMIALMLVMLMAVGLFTACTNVRAADGAKEPEPEITEPEPETGRDTLTIAIESEPTTLNPYDHAAVVSGYMNQLTYNRLFRLNIDTLEPEPDLCESFEAVDELTWRFKLREGVMFHDGTEMTAEDVKASMEFARSFTSSNRYTSFWTDVEAEDKYTVVIRTDGPYALILNDLASNGNTVVPKHLIDSGNDFNENPIGTGPYKFIGWTLGDRLEFERNGDYFDLEHMPAIEKLIWRVIPEGASRTIALETGEADLIVDVASTDVERLKETEGVTVTEVEGTRINFMALNNEKAPFDDPLVRKAVNCLIDKEAVIEVAANGQGSVAVGMNPSPFRGVTDGGADAYSPEKALEYLKSAGVDPTEMIFTCMVYTDATRRAAEVIQGCLAEAGITMEIETLDFAAFLSRLLEGDYEAGIAGYSSSDIITYMKGLWHSSSINAANSTRISDPELDRLIDLASATIDEDARADIVREISLRVNEAAPFVPLYISSVIRAFDSELEGAEVSASGLMRWQDLHWAE